VDLHRIDLNLLVSLDMLLAERNVTHAAQRLSISQPA
jgi:DNA-binding transcriptional LysR family regulator